MKRTSFLACLVAAGIKSKLEKRTAVRCEAEFVELADSVDADGSRWQNKMAVGPYWIEFSDGYREYFPHPIEGASKARFDRLARQIVYGV